MFYNFMTMVEHGWTSVLKKQMIELELNLSKLTDFIMHTIEYLLTINIVNYTYLYHRINILK